MIFNKTLTYILSKWDMSLRDINRVGKILLYIPALINNILTQVFLFVLFPILYLYFYFDYKTEPLFIMGRMYVLYHSLKKLDNK